LHLAQPEKNFLVCEAVERASETVERCTEGKERVGKGRANEFTSVCRDITSFMVTDK
jgi:hypothetical protein